MKTIMIVGAGSLQAPAYIEAHSLGLRVVAIDRNKDAPGMELADACYLIDTRDARGAIEVARAEKIDGILTLCTDFPVRTVAAVAEDLHLAGCLPNTALIATHKGLMREALGRFGAPIPDYRRVRNIHQAKQAIEDLGLPAIFKPVCSSGSRGVFKLSNLLDIETAYRHANDVDPSSGEILVEEFIDGPEVSVEVISYKCLHKIIAITDKLTTGDPYWVELGHMQPSRLPMCALETIRDCATVGLEALGISDSPSHVEIKIGKRGPILIEIGARLGGDFITTELVPRSTGVNMVKAAINLALGIKPDLEPTRDRGVVIMYLNLEPGLVKRIRGLETAINMPCIVAMKCELAIGDTVQRILSSHNRCGYVICEAESINEAESRAIDALSVIKVDIERNDNQ